MNAFSNDFFSPLFLGATKEIGTALTRICLRHRAVEAKMKTFTRYVTWLSFGKNVVLTRVSSKKRCEEVS